MKIIFSRKGFDSSAGGFPSLIFPDGTLFSIPIPSSSDDCKYSHLPFLYDGDSIQSILNQLTNNKICAGKKWIYCDYFDSSQKCHYDPVRLSNSMILGQASASESHLRNKKIDRGDVFLFYGWYRRVHKINNSWCYVPDAPNVHLIWAYMIIEDVFRLDTDQDKLAAIAHNQELARHPHLSREYSLPNSVYVSGENSLLTYSANRCLSDLRHYEGRSKWRLPRGFNQPQAFSYLNNFELEGNDVVIRYQGYGQEFVLDLAKVEALEDRDQILRFLRSVQSTPPPATPN